MGVKMDDHRSDLPELTATFGALKVDLLIDVPENAGHYVYSAFKDLVNVSFSDLDTALVQVSATLCGRNTISVPIVNSRPVATPFDFIEAESAAPYVMDVLRKVVVVPTTVRRLIVVVAIRDVSSAAIDIHSTAEDVGRAFSRYPTRVVFMLANQDPKGLATVLNLDPRRCLHVANHKLHMLPIVLHNVIDRIRMLPYGESITSYNDSTRFELSDQECTLPPKFRSGDEYMEQIGYLDFIEADELYKKLRKGYE